MGMFPKTHFTSLNSAYCKSAHTYGWLAHSPHGASYAWFSYYTQIPIKSLFAAEKSESGTEPFPRVMQDLIYGSLASSEVWRGNDKSWRGEQEEERERWRGSRKEAHFLIALLRISITYSMRFILWGFYRGSLVYWEVYLSAWLSLTPAGMCMYACMYAADWISFIQQLELKSSFAGRAALEAENLIGRVKPRRTRASLPNLALKEQPTPKSHKTHFFL